MNPTVIHLERLDLDLRGIPPELARAAVDALGPAIGAAVAAAVTAGGAPPASRSSRPTADVRTLRLGPAASVADVRAAIAAEVAAALLPASSSDPHH